ncbi:MAG: hypothetical protein DYG98_25190 [Haliscomenobacteraceae bacterium CHB4]|nr:hypothetical protein [Saprospiraceae bacterium]MCE7926353.1 hypothetical protein [Haliscomenobacteraceae bacterium CHB4]
MKNLRLNIVLLLSLGIASCDSGPKVIESEPAAANSNPGAQEFHGGQIIEADDHKVVAEEALHTEKYTYVRVNENGESYWIAIPKTAVEIGATYYYKGGLLKKNFPSREYNRVFETIYLVSGISKQPSGSAVDQALSQTQGAETVAPPKDVKPAAGAVKIADIVGNLSKYEGKQVKVTGKCVKINPMIMGRNWVHLQDGSANNFDLTITTMENIAVGDIVTLEGTIAVNKDFGAGYKYNVIMEGATVKQ